MRGAHLSRSGRIGHVRATTALSGILLDMSPASLLVQINERHGTTFTLWAHYLHGESAFGAHAVSDRDGRRGVLKLWEWQPDFVARQRALAAVLARLRDGRYPAPLPFLIGCTATTCYCIQERLPGRPLQTLAPHLLPRLLALNALQRCQALPGPQDWPHRIVTTVLHGGDGYCLLESLRTYSSTTAELLSAVQTLVRRHADTPCATGDLVHYDFNPANLLMHAGQISGVIDWQDPCSGDCAFDLSTLLCYTWEHPEVRDRLWASALERAGPEMLGVYLAHMILRQVDWAIRHHGAAATAAWCRTAHSILTACRALGVS